MKKRKTKAFLDSDIIEVEGSKALKSPKDARKRALENMKEKIMNQLVKSISERAIRAEEDDDPEEVEKLIKKANKLKKSRD